MKFIYQQDGKINRKPYPEFTEKQYIEICRKIWGVVPVEVLWATSSKMYINELNKNTRV